MPARAETELEARLCNRIESGLTSDGLEVMGERIFARELFSRDERAFSSGCIRLERPLDLAALLLENQPAWSRPAIEAALQTGTEQMVRLAKRVPVHLLYWTAWISPADGQLNFRDDIYDRDARVLRELNERPPS